MLDEQYIQMMYHLMPYNEDSKLQDRVLCLWIQVFLVIFTKLAYLVIVHSFLYPNDEEEKIFQIISYFFFENGANLLPALLNHWSFYHLNLWLKVLFFQCLRIQNKLNPLIITQLLLKWYGGNIEVQIFSNSCSKIPNDLNK